MRIPDLTIAEGESKAARRGGPAGKLVRDDNLHLWRALVLGSSVILGAAVYWLLPDGMEKQTTPAKPPSVLWRKGPSDALPRGETVSTGAAHERIPWDSSDSAAVAVPPAGGEKPIHPPHANSDGPAAELAGGIHSHPQR
jgi:hypothetical protein